MHPSFRNLLFARNALFMYTRSQARRGIVNANVVNSAIVHKESDQQFLMKLNDSVARVDYKKDGDHLDLFYSYVPQQSRGTGLGHALAKGTFDYIAENKLKITITCDFLRRVYDENKDKYKDILIK